MQAGTRRCALTLAVLLALSGLGIFGQLPAQATAPAPPPSAGPSLPAAATATVYAGRLANGTTGTATPGGLTVTGTEVDSSGTTAVATATARAGADGSFQLSDLPSNKGDSVDIATSYLGVTYVQQADPPTPTVVTVYETSTDTSAISVLSETLTVLLTKQANTYQVAQLMALTNSSDRTFVGRTDPGTGLFQTYELSVPNGIANDIVPFQGMRGQLSVAQDGQPVSSDPMPPGEIDVAYSYSVNVARSGWPVSQPVIYQTARTELLLDPGLTATGAGFKFKQFVTVQGKKYRNFEGPGLAPGTNLTADITPVSSGSLTLWIGLAVAITVVAALALVVPRLVRKPATEGASASLLRSAKKEKPAREPLPEMSRDQLVEAIATLDERHVKGDIADDDYVDERSELKRRLMALSPAEEAAQPPEDPAPPA